MEINSPPIDLWNVSAPLQPFTGGHRNTAFRTEGLTQDRVFKTTRRSEAALRWLEPIHKSAAQSGFCVPRAIPSRNGNLIESGWTCEPFLVGHTFSPIEMPQITPLIKDFHARLTGHPQRPGFLSATALTKHGKGGDVDLTALPPRLADICKQVWATLQPTTVVHADLNPSNLIHSKNCEIGLIDWDECRVDAPIFDIGQTSKREELALKSWETACSWQLEPSYARSLLAEVYRLADTL